MLVIIFVVAFFVLIGSLAVEIGIASWNIHRANRYRQRKERAETFAEVKKEEVERITDKFRTLDKYATDISWLLSFLYGRYNNFSDISEELEKGVPKQTDDGSAPVSEVDRKYQDLKQAEKIIKRTVGVYNKIEGMMTSVASLLSSIAQDLEEEEDEEDEEDGSEAKQDDNEITANDNQDEEAKNN